MFSKVLIQMWKDCSLSGDDMPILYLEGSALSLELAVFPCAIQSMPHVSNGTHFLPLTRPKSALRKRNHIILER